MKEIILLKQGEIVLKGLNRKSFEALLLKNIRANIKKYGEFKIYTAQSTVYVEPKSDDIYIDDVLKSLSKVFGIVALSKAVVCQKDIVDIINNITPYLSNALLNAKTFKVEARRSDKKFHLKSPEICTEIGGYICKSFPHLMVDVHKPDITVTVEIRDYNAFLRVSNIKGSGGMPIGSNGKALLMLSGGLDSPVAGYMTAKRGATIEALHFHSYPYTSERARDKVIEIGNILSSYCGDLNLHIVSFTKIQEEIKKNCREELFTIIMRRLMMKIAERVAVKNKCLALITGESIGQVASQTIEALVTTDNAVNMPVFRPVIGMDKDEIVAISRKIGCFETCIMPYDDCCSLFAPRHPKTRPSLKEVIEDESRFDFEPLLEEAVNNVITVICKN